MTTTFTLLTLEVWEFFPHQAILWHQLGVPQFNSMLTLSTWRYYQIPQLCKTVPSFRCNSVVSLITHNFCLTATNQSFPLPAPHWVPLFVEIAHKTGQHLHLPVLLRNITKNRGFPGGASGKEFPCQCRRHKQFRFNPWVGKMPWRRAWLQSIASQRVRHSWSNLAHMHAYLNSKMKRYIRQGLGGSWA